MYDYAIRLERDESTQGFAVFCRDLPELNSYGDTVEDALREAVDAIESTLSIYVDQRRSIPAASAPKDGEHTVRLSAVTVAKIVLWNAMMERGMRKADLCRMISAKPTTVDRLVDFIHTSKIEQLEDALKHLGIKSLPPYEEARFIYATHKGLDDFTRLRAWAHRDSRITTEEAQSIIFNTLLPRESTKELQDAVFNVIQNKFRNWAYPYLDYKGKRRNAGILFNLSDMPSGIIIQNDWIELSPGDLFKLDEAAYWSLLGIQRPPSS